MRNVIAFFRRFPPWWRLFLMAIVPGTLVTMFWGRVSSRDVFESWSSYFAPRPFGLLDWLVNVTLFAIVSWALILGGRALSRLARRLWSKSESAGSPGGQAYLLLDDVPLGPGSADDFEREGFVATIAKIVALPPNANSFVLALESPWGSGKSSVLALLTRHLATHPDKPLLVRFNPWLATGQERVSRAFFAQFSAALLGEGERALAVGLVRFGEALEDLLPARARTFSTVGLQHFRRLVGRIPVIDLDGEQERLRRAVAAVGRPIVVIIDDIDRLPADDIRVVFQLVKAVADFPRVAYLLAFDPAPIDLALAFDGSVDSGRQFRDKIVQANLNLPRVRYSKRKQYFTAKLTERLKYWQFSLDPREERLVVKAVPIVLAALRTPRDMKRVLNKTLLVADNIRREVNFADVLVFETIHAKYPLIVERIRRNPRVVDPAGNGDEEMSDSAVARMVWSDISDEKRERAESLKEFVEPYPHDREVLSGLLAFAFPPMFDDSPEGEDHDLVGDRRIAVRENLLKLLYQGLHGEFLSAQDATTFLTDPSSRPAMLADALEGRSLPAWLSHIQSFIASVSVASPVSLMQQIVEAVNALYAQSRIDVTDDARWVLLDVLKVIPEHERSVALERLLGDDRTASVTEEVLTSLLRDAGMWENGEYLGIASTRSARDELAKLRRQDLDHLCQLWVKTISNLGVRAIVLDYPNAGGVLFRWGQLSKPPYAVVASEVDDALDDEKVAVGLLSYFHAGKSLTGVERFILDSAWQKLRKQLQTERVPNATKEKFEEYFEELEAKRGGVPPADTGDPTRSED